MRPDRTAILNEHQMLLADTQAQRMFWQRYNRRPRRSAPALGVLIQQIVSDQRRGLPAAKRLAQVARAWGELLPPRLAVATRVQSLRGGRLTIRVESAAARFMLSRGMGEVLLGALREKLQDLRIDRIQYTFGPAAQDSRARPQPRPPTRR